MSTRMKVVLAIVFCALVVYFIGYSGGPTVDTSSPNALARSVLGEPADDDDSGVVKVDYNDESAVIQYHFYPVGMASIKEEIGVHLAKKIRRLYEADDTFGMVHFQIWLPYEDSMGNITWKPQVRFSVGRQLFAEINWDNFNTMNLLDIAYNVEGID